ncbi:MAG: CIS tube protein [Parafilimonas sp.]
MSLGQLQKMTLVAYTDNTFQTKVPGLLPYEVLINPESYTITYGTASTDQTAQGSSETQSAFRNRLAQTLSFKFLFDGTGVIKKDEGLLSGLSSGLAIPGLNANPPDVAQMLSDFKKVVYDYNSETHEPPYVQLQWGLLLYNCKLKTMTINFKLFKPDGSPLRAEADCSFEGVIDEKKLAGIENRQSPDLTHIRTVQEGDTLSLMCYREYGDSKYYYQVAQFNNLIDFKNLKTGAKLLFPPLANN